MLPSPSLIYMLEFLQNKRWQESGGQDPEERMLKGPGCGEGRRDDEGEKEERNGWGEMPRQGKWGGAGNSGGCWKKCRKAGRDAGRLRAKSLGDV